MIMKPISEIKMRLGIDPRGPVQAFFTDTCAKHMDQYVPYEEGMLRENVQKTYDSIVYESPYAHYQYIGKLYVMDNGKGAYYNPDYGFWSKKGVAKQPTEIDLVYHTQRNRFLLGQENGKCRNERCSKRGARLCQWP